MSVFNSLGSNYTKLFIIASFGFGTKKDTRDLKKILHDTYDAQTIQLTFKGREAITLLLRQLELPAGSGVAINGFTCYAVYEAIEAAGLKPVYLDIEESELNFTPESLEAALKQEKNVKAVIVQNTLGTLSDVPAIKKICDHQKIALIEDLAHSIGLNYANNQLAGTVADFSMLSFSQDKVVDGVSGGAAIFKHERDIIPTKWAKVSLRTRLRSRIYPFSSWLIRRTMAMGLGRAILRFMKAAHLLSRPMSGLAGKVHILPSWYCGLAVKSFNSLESTLEHRKKIAEIYRKNLPNDLLLKHHDNNIYLRFPILVNKRTGLIKQLRKSSFYLSDTWYDAPIGPKKYLDKTDYKTGSCPNAEAVAAKIVNLPTHVNINEEQAKQLAEKVKNWVESSSEH